MLKSIKYSRKLTATLNPATLTDNNTTLTSKSLNKQQILPKQVLFDFFKEESTSGKELSD